MSFEENSGDDSDASDVGPSTSNNNATSSMQIKKSSSYEEWRRKKVGLVRYVKDSPARVDKRNGSALEDVPPIKKPCTNSTPQTSGVNEGVMVESVLELTRNILKNDLAPDSFLYGPILKKIELQTKEALKSKSADIARIFKRTTDSLAKADSLAPDPSCNPASEASSAHQQPSDFRVVLINDHPNLAAIPSTSNNAKTAKIEVIEEKIPTIEELDEMIQKYKRRKKVDEKEILDLRAYQGFEARVQAKTEYPD